MTGQHFPTRTRRDRSVAGNGSARPRTVRSTGIAPAGWLFAGVALLLIGVLTYYLTLTARPEISQISPAPNSSTAPGPVEFSAIVTSSRSIERAQLSIDGEAVESLVEQTGDNQWRVFHEQVLDRGAREIYLEVTDSSGRTAEHSWSIQAAGDLISPRLALISPPTNVILAPGPNGVSFHVTTFGELDEVIVTFDDEPGTVEIEKLEPGSEYSDAEGIVIHDWHILATSDLPGGAVRIEAEVTDVHGATTSDSWTILAAGNVTGANARYFERTGEYIIEPFLSFWVEHDGESSIGPPVSPQISLENGVRHQYFRYARLELDSEGDVHLGLLGREIFGEPETPPDRPPGNNSRLFEPTGHYIRGPIREFWEENGGLATFGYPLSQEFETERGYAQYFERSLIEVVVLGRAEAVELAPLGEQVYKSQVAEPVSAEDDDRGS